MIFSVLTGGRPMTRGAYRFRSEINGEPVCYFTDAFGRLWLAEGPWSLFRVRVPPEGDTVEQMIRDYEQTKD